MRSIFGVLVPCVVLMAACSPSTEPAPLSPGRQLFEQNILELLNTACADCHSNAGDDYDAPDFLDTVDGQYYESLVSDSDFVGCAVETSRLLRKGLDPNHPGKQLADPQYEKMRAWLVQEAIDRFQGVCAAPVSDPSPGTMPKPQTTAVMEAIAQFGACMTYDDWKNAGMDRIGGTTSVLAGNQSPCFSCHATGGGGNWMPNPDGPDAEIRFAFAKMRKAYSIFHLVTATSNDDNSFKDIVPSDRWRDTTKDEGHPTYTLSQGSLTALETWFSTTYTKWKKGPCTP